MRVALSPNGRKVVGRTRHRIALHTSINKKEDKAYLRHAKADR